VAPQSLRAEQVEATRQAIIASARRLFGANGYSATSIDDIAGEARVTKGAVYHHFETKHELFRAVYAEVEADAQARTSRAARPGSLPIDLLVQGMHAYLDASLDPEVQRITLIDAPAVLGPEPEGPAGEQPFHQAMRKFVAAGMRAGAITKLDADALAHVLAGSILQGAMVVARSPDPTAARRRVGAVLEAMIRGLAPRRASSKSPSPAKNAPTRRPRRPA
jgi:AcrR family transcriptional regulator